MTAADRIRAYAAAHPDATQSDVAAAVGVTRQAVHAALRRQPRERRDDVASRVLSVRLTAAQMRRLERAAGGDVAACVRAWVESL